MNRVLKAAHALAQMFASGRSADHWCVVGLAVTVLLLADLHRKLFASGSGEGVNARKTSRLDFLLPSSIVDSAASITLSAPLWPPSML